MHSAAVISRSANRRPKINFIGLISLISLILAPTTATKHIAAVIKLYGALTGVFVIGAPIVLPVLPVLHVLLRRPLRQRTSLRSSRFMVLCIPPGYPLPLGAPIVLPVLPVLLVRLRRPLRQCIPLRLSSIVLPGSTSGGQRPAR